MVNLFQVFDFLITFPPHEDITSMVCDGPCSIDDIFPKHVPYKTMYSVFAFRAALAANFQEVRKIGFHLDLYTKPLQGAINFELIRHGVHAIGAALVAQDNPEEDGLDRMKVMAVKALVDCLLLFLKGIILMNFWCCFYLTTILDQNQFPLKFLQRISTIRKI